MVVGFIKGLSWVQVATFIPLLRALAGPGMVRMGREGRAAPRTGPGAVWESLDMFAAEKLPVEASRLVYPVTSCTRSPVRYGTTSGLRLRWTSGTPAAHARLYGVPL
jgi:hypothetical protein